MQYETPQEKKVNDTGEKSLVMKSLMQKKTLSPMRSSLEFQIEFM